jgi:hypothetical protein
MKFLLIIQICSVITQQCTDLIKIYPMYNSHFDCATGGFLRGNDHNEGTRSRGSQSKENVNELYMPRTY